MSNIRGKLNLAELKSVIRKIKNKKGEPIDCLIIPIKENGLFHSTKGAIYLDIIAFENDKIPEYTHSIKQSIPSDKFKVMTTEEKRAMPFLGNLELMKPTSDGAVQSSELPKDNTITETDGSDDLPF